MTGDTETGVVRTGWIRVPVELLGVWLAMTAGALALWSVYALTLPEPTRTFTFNFIEANVGFISQLSVGGALLTTAGLETARRVSNRRDRNGD